MTVTTSDPELGFTNKRRSTTFLFTDIVGSTEMLTMLGEATWLRALREHNSVVLDVVERNGGSMLKFLGDGWMITFSSPRDAIDAAVGIQRSHQGTSDDGFRVRIGVHAGTALEEPSIGEGLGDLVGKDVVLASRITHEAGPGEIVASADVVDVLGGGPEGYERFDGGRIAHLKGLGPHLVFGVNWAS